MLRSAFATALTITSLLAPAAARAESPPDAGAVPSPGATGAGPSSSNAKAAPSLGGANAGPSLGGASALPSASNASGAAPYGASAAPPASDAGASAARSRGAGGERPPGRFGLALLSGYGVNDFSADAPESGRPYQLGFGLRAGYTFGSGIYLGGTFVRHLGGSVEDALPEADFTYKTSTHVTYAGAEFGTDIEAGPLVFRPYIGVGGSSLSVEVEALGVKASTSDRAIAVWPGATMFYPVGDFQIGADLRYVIVTESEKNSSPSFFGHLGYQF
jgi:hypothetical protein